jgi:inhibitor of cysteine peptidase
MHLRVPVMAMALMLLVSGCFGDSVTTIDVDAAGTTVEVAADGTLEVRLEGNPTTGYLWVVLESTVVELSDETHKPESDATGSGGITTFTFSPLGPGTGDLVLGYLRPWEEGIEPIDTFTVTVTVAE